MKRMYMIGIVIVLILLAGAYLFSPFSPLNKATINGESIKLTSGYTVENSSSDKLVLNNTTNKIIISTANQKTDLETSIDNYKSKYGEKYNITSSKAEMNKEKEIYKTIASTSDKKLNITKYWFVQDGTLYTIQSDNPQPGTEEVVTEIINSL